MDLNSRGLCTKTFAFSGIIFFLAFAVIAVTLLSSCEKDDDKTPTSLKDTTWENVDTYTESDDTKCIDTYTLKFTSKTAFTLSAIFLEDNVNVGTDSQNGTYTYNSSTAIVTITADRFSEIGKANGNKLIFDEGEKNEQIFTRK